MTFPDLTRLAPRMLLSTALGLVVFHAQGAFAQQSGKIAFQTVSIHSSDGEGRCAPNASAGQTFTVKNCELGALILFAYDVLQQQLLGDTSLLNEPYDVTAKAERPVSRSEMKRMLQTLLEDRFKLTLRHQTKETSVYALVVAEGGPKFPLNQGPSEEGPKPVQGAGGQLVFQNMAMADLVFALARRISDRIVVDKTGLAGKYDVDMTWYLELGKPNPPSVFTAVHVLGVNLEPQNGPVEFLVIDHCERPSEK